MGKILNYKILGTALKSLSDACFKADEQQRNGEKYSLWKQAKHQLHRGGLCRVERFDNRLKYIRYGSKRDYE